MELRHEFTVPVSADEAWRVLLDIERVAPCMPGATVNSFDGETIEGSVKVKVGPMTVTYRGTAAFEERDESAHRIVLRADGKEARGQGTARATVTGSLVQHGTGGEAVTSVTVLTDLTVTGRPAQFGRGVLAEVGDKLLGRFADCLAGELGERDAAPATPGTEAAPEPRKAEQEAAPGPGAPAAAGPATVPSATAAPDAPDAQAAHAHPDGDSPLAAVPAGQAQEEPLDLLRLAGAPVAKRIAAGVAGVLGLAALLRRLRRRRKPHRLARGRR